MAVTTIRVERDKLARFSEICRAEHSSVNQVFRRLIDERLAEADREAA